MRATVVLSEIVAETELPGESPSLANPATCAALSADADTASWIFE